MYILRQIGIKGGWVFLQSVFSLFKIPILVQVMLWSGIEAGILGFFIKRCFVLAQKIYHKGIVQLY